MKYQEVNKYSFISFKQYELNILPLTLLYLVQVHLKTLLILNHTKLKIKIMVTTSNAPAIAPVLSFDDYKQKYNNMQTSLAVDHTEAVTELTHMQSMIQYFQDGFCSEEESKFLLTTTIPKISRILLKRRWLESSKQFQQHMLLVEQYLHSVLGLISSHFKQYSECFSSLLVELLDPNQTFYRQYGYPKYDPIYVYGNLHQMGKYCSVASVSDPSSGASGGTGTDGAVVAANTFWLDDVVPGVTVVDVQNARGEWEMGIVDSLSETRTEIEVSRFSDDSKSWFRTDDPRVAKSGTRIGGSSTTEGVGAVGGAAAVAVAATGTVYLDGAGPAAAPAVPPCVCVDSTEDLEWKQTLRRGMLVDVLTSTNHWVEVR